MDEPDLETEGTDLKRLKNTKDVRKLLTSSGPLMIVVYAKWCGHCKTMFETWKDLAKKVKGKASVYVIESSDYKDKDIQGYPSMRIIKNGKSSDYNGGRSTEELTSSLLGTPLGGKRSRRHRTKLLVRRVRKTANRTLRRNVALV
jgi:thiol-disulfide isomerase/thioredoxin